ncbi:hypothetical protein [Caballeronia glathei]|uniref:hypothetical protein n=1 Tax=Caballeronia glathei TaxID=60547 RepID=UPI00146FD169|nr:hypothetical protein [Caballeronia glathei]
MAQEFPLKPGDEAEPGTPGTGEDLCQACKGSGTNDVEECAYAAAQARWFRASVEVDASGAHLLVGTSKRGRPLPVLRDIVDRAVPGGTWITTGRGNATHGSDRASVARHSESGDAGDYNTDHGEASTGRLSSGSRNTTL